MYANTSARMGNHFETNGTVLRGPGWGLFLPEIRAFTGFWGEISSTVSKVLSDRKGLFEHKNGR